MGGESESADEGRTPEPGSGAEGTAAESAGEASAGSAASDGEAPSAGGGETGASGEGTKPKRWYIVHTYSGHEARAKHTLLERAKSFKHEGDFDEILIPEENVVEVVKGEKRTSKRKFFPGYILVRMHLSDETWHIVKDTPKVTGFVGSGESPTPIDDEEVARMTQQIKEGAAKPKPKIRFEEGENVRVISGPFANFSGFVDEVFPEKEKVRVMVQVFGRATPVMLDYMNVEKA